MVRTRRPRTMRDVWDEEKRRKSASRVSGAVLIGGAAPPGVARTRAREIYGNVGQQGTMYRKKSSMPGMAQSPETGYLSLKEAIGRIEPELFDIDGQVSAITELALEGIVDVSYDAARGEVIVHADRDYSIPLALEGINTGTLEWSYNNGVLEITFQNKENDEG